MNTTKLTNRQLFFILFMIRTTIIVAVLPPVVTVFNTLQDAWASVIVSFFTASVLVIIICRLGIHFPQMTVFEYSQKLLGPWFGRVLCFSFLWGLLEIAAVDIRISAKRSSPIFPEHAANFFIASVAAVSALAAYQPGCHGQGRRPVIPILCVDDRVEHNHSPSTGDQPVTQPAAGSGSRHHADSGEVLLSRP